MIRFDSSAVRIEAGQTYLVTESQRKTTFLFQNRFMSDIFLLARRSEALASIISIMVDRKGHGMTLRKGETNHNG